MGWKCTDKWYEKVRNKKRVLVKHSTYPLITTCNSSRSSVIITILIDGYDSLSEFDSLGPKKIKQVRNDRIVGDDNKWHSKNVLHKNDCIQKSSTNCFQFHFSLPFHEIPFSFATA
ncbi:hypothetical protein LOAG_07983 [Loa loa]|uniref:Uncharacterized protein n=1 Tax=Loa loa TaxID=7209 RepID=A0A1S0TVE2_LOALO|nr:hypothetical protein LOAG_07983 [Loa loa]EFO20508.1 hypothetical protein LOAG_07983 [Loa loa]